jgi:hypothetical protein
MLDRWARQSMVEMTRSASGLASEFDDFLFAPIGEDGNGMLLSVLSALARLDVDPWQEAAKMTRLSGSAATVRLASLIAKLPDQPSSHQNVERIAARVICLLPRRESSSIASRRSLVDGAALFNSSAGLCVISCVIFMAVLVSAQLVISAQQLPTHLVNADAQTAGTVSPKLPAAKSGD